MVLVDTADLVTSHYVAEPVDLSEPQQQMTRTLHRLIRQRQVQLLGPIRQEVLSGIREERSSAESANTFETSPTSRSMNVTRRKQPERAICAEVLELPPVRWIC